MRTPCSGFLGAVLLPASLGATAAELSVTFVQPDRYQDAAYSRPFPAERQRAEVQRDIEQHLQRLAARYLAPDDALAIEVLDIDLAGHFHPFRFQGADVRIVRDITWPRMQLRYTLTRGGQVVAGAEERLADMNFLMTGNRYSSTDRLRYEKAMLDEWFYKRFARR
jgi:hypothetical protein